MAADAIDRYIGAARAADCPPDQILNFIGAQIVLQPRQLLASAAARQCDEPDGPIEIGYGGARGGGKSHWGVAQVVADDCMRFPGLKALILRKVGKSNKENFEDLRRRVLGGVPNDYNRGEGVLYLPNGSRVFLGHFQKDSDIDAYLGIEYDVILVEEATTLTSGKYRDITTCCRSSKPGWRPRLYSTTNPGNVGHAWYKARFIDAHRRGDGSFIPLAAQRGATRFINATADDNAFLSREYRTLILDTLTGWKLRAWRYGDWDIAAGQFFSSFRRDVHVIPPFAPPASWPAWASLDYGFTHYTVAYLLTRGDGAIYLLDEYAARKQLVPANAEGIRAMLGRSGLTPAQLWQFVAGTDVFAQRHTGATIAADYLSQGIGLTPATTDRINGAGEILSRLGDVDRDPPIAPRLFISERCTGLIETLPLLQHDPHRPEDVLKWDTDDDGIGGDDYYDAARYGVMAGATTPQRDEPPTDGYSTW
ncbi:MAG TPA: phage terminase large subunit [Chloroflexaceae bacterium]|nr:phage terminase large subunit [Chloroflexaceae bacterium]